MRQLEKLDIDVLTYLHTRGGKVESKSVLSKSISVSPDGLRKSLKRLENRGLIRFNYGGYRNKITVVLTVLGDVVSYRINEVYSLLAE